MADESVSARVARVKGVLPIADVIGRDVVLSGHASSGKRRGKCPFHGGKSSSFSVETGGARAIDGFAHCFGCQWHGDVVSFVQDMRGLSFGDALRVCEALAGITPGGDDIAGAGPLRRRRDPAPARERTFVASIDMAREIWRLARADHRMVRRYFEGRGIAANVLGDDRLVAFRYLVDCPVMPWATGARPRSVPIAPAIMALMARPEIDDGGMGGFRPCGLHVTYLNPDGTGTMLRRKPWATQDDEDPMLPKRRMLGEAGGACVVLGHYRSDALLYVGEGNETVLSGMALADAPVDAVGIATLSLENLQGAPMLRQGRYGRIWPLYAIEPDPQRPAFTIPGHNGHVIGLIDSDMAPLRGQRDRVTRQHRGEAVIELKRGPIVQRAITGADRANICAQLFVKSWRMAGVASASAVRAPLGKDFNDVVAETMS